MVPLFMSNPFQSIMCHMPYVPDTGERAPLSPQPNTLVLDLLIKNGRKVELTLVLVICRDG